MAHAEILCAPGKRRHRGVRVTFLQGTVGEREWRGFFSLRDPAALAGRPDYPTIVRSPACRVPNAPNQTSQGGPPSGPRFDSATMPR